ncbi:MAG: FtsX-like permease family protein [bacterium]
MFKLSGLLKIALKLLVNDGGKFFTLIIGIMFAVFLIMQMTSSFVGVMQRTSADIINVGAKIWVMDPSVTSARDNIPLPNYILDAVRSMNGVKYAIPIYIGSGLVKLRTGRYQSVEVIGLDDTTLFGRPAIIKGSINAIYNNDAFIVVKNADYEKLDSPAIGTTFEINDHRGVVVAIAKCSMSGLFGTPAFYTTYTRAIRTLPTTRFTMSYILAHPKNELDLIHIKKQVRDLGYMAITEQEFVNMNTNYYMFKTGMGTNILIMTLISFIVGLSVAGQTFYTFVLENLNKFGALKAIGAKKSDLIQIILFQSGVVGFLGYGLGVFLSSIMIALAKLRLANYASMVTAGNLSFSFFMVLLIIAFSSYIGIRKVLKIEPFDIFRG